MRQTSHTLAPTPTTEQLYEYLKWYYPLVLLWRLVSPKGRS